MNDMPKARLATLCQLQEMIENHLQPVPKPDTLRTWFDRAGIPRFKANPNATRGGGPCYYSVSHVEKLLRNRTGSVGGRAKPDAGGHAW